MHAAERIRESPITGRGICFADSVLEYGRTVRDGTLRSYQLIYSVLIYNDELRVFGKRLKSVVSMTTPPRKTAWTFIEVIYVLSSVLQFRVTRGKISFL